MVKRKRTKSTRSTIRNIRNTIKRDLPHQNLPPHKVLARVTLHLHIRDTIIEAIVQDPALMIDEEIILVKEDLDVTHVKEDIDMTIAMRKEETPVKEGGKEKLTLQKEATI